MSPTPPIPQIRPEIRPPRSHQPELCRTFLSYFRAPALDHRSFCRTTMQRPPSSAPSLFRRLFSALYETLLLIGVTAVFVLLPQTLYAMDRGQTASSALLLLHLILVMGLYFVWFWSHGGQTLAMKTWKIRLVDAQETPVNIPRALLRFVLCWPSWGLMGAGLLWAIFDSEHQFLHDRWAGTRLIGVSDDPPTSSTPLPQKGISHSV